MGTKLQISASFSILPTEQLPVSAAHVPEIGKTTKYELSMADTRAIRGILHNAFTRTRKINEQTGSRIDDLMDDHFPTDEHAELRKRFIDLMTDTSFSIPFGERQAILFEIFMALGLPYAVVQNLTQFIRQPNGDQST